MSSKPLFASCGSDFKFWDVNSLELKCQYSTDSKNVTSFNWAPDCRQVCSASSGSSVLNFGCISKDRTYFKHFVHQRVGVDYMSAAFSPFSNDLVSAGGRNGYLEVFSIRSPTCTPTRISDINGDVKCIAWDPRGITSQRFAVGTSKSSIVFVNHQLSRVILTVKDDGPVTRLKFYPSNNSVPLRLLSVTSVGTVSIWDSVSGTRTFSLPRSVHPCLLYDAALSPINAKLMLSVGHDKRIVCYDVVANKQIMMSRSDDAGESCVFLSNGYQFLLGTHNGSVQLHDIRNKTVLRSHLAVHAAPVTHIEIMPDSTKFEPTWTSYSERYVNDTPVAVSVSPLTDLTNTALKSSDGSVARPSKIRASDDLTLALMDDVGVPKTGDSVFASVKNSTMFDFAVVSTPMQQPEKRLTAKTAYFGLSPLDATGSSSESSISSLRTPHSASNITNSEVKESENQQRSHSTIKPPPPLQLSKIDEEFALINGDQNPDHSTPLSPTEGSNPTPKMSLAAAAAVNNAIHASMTMIKTKPKLLPITSGAGHCGDDVITTIKSTPSSDSELKSTSTVGMVDGTPPDDCSVDVSPPITLPPGETSALVAMIRQQSKRIDQLERLLRDMHEQNFRLIYQLNQNIMDSTGINVNRFHQLEERLDDLEDIVREPRFF